MKLSRYGGDCYAYCMLAAGLIDLIIETEIKPYDIVAIIPIVAGAGGIVTTWENGPAQNGGRIVVAGDKRVHQAALEILERLEPRRAGHEGIERRPELAAILILLLQDLVLGAGKNEMPAREQIRARTSRSPASRPLRRGRPPPSKSAGGSGRRNRARRTAFIRRMAASAQATVGAPRPSSGSCSSTAALRA